MNLRQVNNIFVMKSTACILFVSTIAFFWACAPRPIPPPQPVEFHPGNPLFSKAEKFFQKKEYENALALYNEYISNFPKGYLTAEAMIKIGLIQTALGKNDRARKTYEHVIDRYPDSFFSLTAKVEILATLSNEGKYRQVIRRAGPILKTTNSSAHLVRTYILLGDSYLATGFAVDALDSYLSAYKKADEPEKENLYPKIERAAKDADPKSIVRLLTPLGREMPADDLIYRLGVKKYEWKKYEDAVSLLSDFVKKFPRHPHALQAENLIEEINEKFTFNHNTLGCLLPLSGPYEIYGHKILNCIELARSRFNAMPNRPPIRLIIKDTESDPEKAALAVEELSEERVGAIIGPVAAHEAAAAAAQEKRIPIVTFSQRDDITTIGDYVFKNFITPKMQVESIVSYAVSAFGLSRFAILYPDEKYGKTFAELFQDEVEAYGGEVVKVETYDPDQTDFADPIKKLAESDMAFIEHPDEKMVGPEFEAIKPVLDFDAIFIPDGPKASGLILPQLAFYDVVGIQLLGTNLWHSHRLIQMAQQFAQGAIMVDGFFAESRSQKVKDFVDIFEETFGDKPGFIEAVAYDTAMILFNLVSRNDIQSRSQVKDEIMNLRNYHGLTGETSFDATGNAQKKLYILQIEKDGFIELKSH
jgi:ABC-type branched-subunit amino acid transport system substrate-binding protein/outer membrane protein assembly factor BamD (BamD/ComL family)